jgi:hypothetical protein
MSSAQSGVRRRIASLVVVAAVAAFAVDVASAQTRTPPSAPVTVVNAADNPVIVSAAAPLPVVGTISVGEPINVIETFAPARAPKRYGPIDGTFTGSLVGHELVPAVPAGQTFIVTHLHFIGFSNISQTPLVRGACSFLLRVESLYTPFFQMPSESSIGTLSDTKSLFLPLAAGEGLFVLCRGTAADGTAPSQGFRVTLGGYFAPAPAAQ